MLPFLPSLLLLSPVCEGIKKVQRWEENWIQSSPKEGGTSSVNGCGDLDRPKGLSCTRTSHLAIAQEPARPPFSDGSADGELAKDAKNARTNFYFDPSSTQSHPRCPDKPDACAMAGMKWTTPQIYRRKKNASIYGPCKSIARSRI